MKRDQIIQLAREAGLPLANRFVGARLVDDVTTEVARFAHLVEAHVRESLGAAAPAESVGTGGPEAGPEAAETRMDTGFHRGPEGCPDTVLLEGGEACPR